MAKWPGGNGNQAYCGGMNERKRPSIVDLHDLLCEYGGRVVLHHESGTPWTFAAPRGEMQEAVNRYLGSQKDSPDQEAAARDLGSWVERILLEGKENARSELCYLALRLGKDVEKGPTKQAEVVGKVMEFVWDRREKELSTGALTAALPHIGESTIREVLAEIGKRGILTIDDREKWEKGSPEK